LSGPAVLLDAMGTLLRLEDPRPRLRAALLRRLGVDVGAAAASAAIRAEIAYYRAHLQLGRDASSLAALRERCADAMRAALPQGAADAPPAELTAALLEAIEFCAYRDAAPALRALRAAGCALVVVSNWDVSLHERLAETGLARLVDAAVASAELGAEKPDTAIFEHALGIAGVAAERAWHVGDSLEADVEGARAAGIRPVLIARAGAPLPAGRADARDAPGGGDDDAAGAVARGASEGGGEAAAAPAGVPVIASLDGLPALVAAGAP
jgi:putative hydrolase of the HAD superfamily